MFSFSDFMELYDNKKVVLTKNCGLRYIPEEPSAIQNFNNSNNSLSYLQVGGKHGVLLILNDRSVVDGENLGLVHHFIFFKDEIYRQTKPEELEENLRNALKVFKIEDGKFDERIVNLYKGLFQKHEAGIFTIFDKKVNDKHSYSFQDTRSSDIKFFDENFESIIKSCENYCEQMPAVNDRLTVKR